MRKIGDFEREAETRLLTKLAKRRSENAAWCEESQFLLCYSEGRVRIWHNQHERNESPIQAAGSGVMVLFFSVFTHYWLGLSRKASCPNPSRHVRSFSPRSRA